MPEANCTPILSRPPTRYPGSTPALAPKPKLLDRLRQRDLAGGRGRVQVPHASEHGSCWRCNPPFRVALLWA
jgi:hypothetical protein